MIPTLSIMSGLLVAATTSTSLKCSTPSISVSSCASTRSATADPSLYEEKEGREEGGRREREGREEKGRGSTKREEEGERIRKRQRRKREDCTSSSVLPGHQSHQRR